MKKLLLFALVLNQCFFMAAQAQSQMALQPGATPILSSGVQETWVARHDETGSSFDYAKAMVVDAAGNIYVTGYTQLSTSGPLNYLTVKYNAAGVRQWTARYNGSGYIFYYPIALAVDAASNVYVMGTVGSHPNYDYITIKYNSSGQEQWVARYNGPGNSSDEARALAVDRAGNVYVTGRSGTDYVTIKYGTAGKKQWVARYNGPGNGDDNVRALAVDDAGNVYVTGNSWNGTNADYATIKYNSAGQELWVSRYNGPTGNDDDRASALAVDSHGNVYVSGTMVLEYIEAEYSEILPIRACATVKYNSIGQQQWVAHISGAEPQRTNNYIGIRDLAVDGDGNVYVTGSRDTDQWEDEDWDFFTIKYNSAGTREWSHEYGITDDDYSTDLAIDGHGNVYVTGASGDHSSNYVTVKYNAAGTQEWVATYNGPGNKDDEAVALAVDYAGYVYVAGSSIGSGTGYDFATIKYTQFPIANAGSDKAIHACGSVKIGDNPTGSGGHGGPYTFSWTPTSDLDNPAAPNPIASPGKTTTYTVTVTETTTGLFAKDEVTVIISSVWSVAHIVDVDDVVFGIDQGKMTGSAPRNNRGLALSPDERFLYLGYILNKYLVRKIDLSVANPADNQKAAVAQLTLPSGSQPARDIATDDRGRVYLALGDKIEIYNVALQTPPLYTISDFAACEGVVTRREKGKPAVYATDRLDKTLKRFVLAEGAGEAITSSRKAGLDGDGEVRIVGANSPRGLDLGKYGTIWIADADNGKVYRVNAAGKTADSTVVEKAMDVAIDTTRDEVFVSQDNRRTIKVLNLTNGKIKRTLAPPAASLNIDLDGEAGFGALSGIAVASCARVFVANEKGRSILTNGDSPFSNLDDSYDVKAADNDPVLVVSGNGLAKESEEEVAVAVAAAVTNYELAQNYPNPFNPSTKINFSLPEAAEASLKIYDVVGQLVQTLVDGVIEAGRHQVVWDGTNRHGAVVASGVYFYQLRTGEFKQVRRMSLVR